MDHKGKNEKLAHALQVRPEAIKVRKDDTFTNARLSFEQEPLENLEQSIADVGLLKNLTIERDPQNPDYFYLICGERRMKCITNLKKKNIKVRVPGTEDDYDDASKVYEFMDVKIVSPKDDLERMKIMIAENAEHMQVPDWDYFQYVLSLDAKTNPDGSKKYSRQDLCNVFNKCEAWISHTLKLKTLPERALKCLQSGDLPRSAAVTLLSAKPEHYEKVLAYAETVVRRNRQKELNEALVEEEAATIEAEAADMELQTAQQVGDRIQERLQSKRGNQARRKVTGAKERRVKAQQEVEAPIRFTEDSIKQSLEENPETVKEGTAAKTRSHKRVREKLKEIKALLDGATDSGYIVAPNGKHYARKDIEIVLAAYEQFLGKKPLDVFALLQPKEGESTQAA